MRQYEALVSAGLKLKNLGRNGEMVQWAKVLVTKADDLQLTPRTLMVRGENGRPKLSSDLLTYTIASAHTECKTKF